MGDTRYVRSTDVFIAYRTFGVGPPDILWLFGGGVPMDSMLEEPRIARFVERVSSFSRLICHDRRGVGLSDPVTSWDDTTLEVRALDVKAVLDDVGTDRAAILACDLSGSHTGAMVAATYPNTVSALVMHNPTPRVFAAPDYPVGTVEGFLDVMTKTWMADIQEGTSGALDLLIGSGQADDQLRAWWIKAVRSGMKLGQVEPAMRNVLGLDSRSILPTIQAPTLIIHDDQGPPWNFADHARYAAEKIPGSRRLELPGAHMYVYVSEEMEAFVDEVEEFITGVRRGPLSDRVLATVLFTDIVDSTKRAAELGDHSWGQLLGQHNEITERCVKEFRGTLIDRAGDGMLATFDGPARAIRCAIALQDALSKLDIPVRAGLHTGEIERKEDAVLGMAVHVGSRIKDLAGAGEILTSSTVKDLAGAGEILTSSTVKDLVLGSGISFDGRGTHALKGVPGDWQVFAVNK